MRLVSTICAGLALLFMAGAAHAQGGTGVYAPPNSGGVNIYSPGQLGIAATTPSRMESTRREANRGRVNPRSVADLPDDPAVILEEAQGAMQRAQVPCRVTEASVVGRARENMPIFETVCAEGTGYIVINEAYAQAVDCALLADGVGDRRADYEMITISECALPGNQMTLARIATYARQAGVDCDIVQGAQIGRTNAGAVFEVACSSGHGYWVRQSSNMWSRENCLKVTALNDTCRFTTSEQRLGLLTSAMRGTAASNCGVTGIGYVGQAGSDEFYEVSCRAGGGFVLKVDDRERVRDAIACDQAAALIGATCRLGG